MSQSDKVSNYFTRSASAFDSLYPEREMNSLMRFINRRFRRDIYERYTMSLDYVKKYSPKSVLDVGCGSGRYALGMHKIGVKKITGVDFSPEMIRLAVEYTKDISMDSEIFRFVCCDFMNFAEDEKYDLVISMGFFDYIKEPVQVLRKMRELSNDSVLASFPSISLYRTPLRKIRYKLKRCPVYFYTPIQIESIAVRAGFGDCDVKKIEGAGMDYFVVFK